MNILQSKQEQIQICPGMILARISIKWSVEKESEWSCGFKPEFYSGNPGLTFAWLTYRKKDYKHVDHALR